MQWCYTRTRLGKRPENRNVHSNRSILICAWLTNLVAREHLQTLQGRRETGALRPPRNEIESEHEPRPHVHTQFQQYLTQLIPKFRLSQNALNTSNNIPRPAVAPSYCPKSLHCPQCRLITTRSPRMAQVRARHQMPLRRCPINLLGDYSS